LTDKEGARIRFQYQLHIKSSDKIREKKLKQREGTRAGATRKPQNITKHIHRGNKCYKSQSLVSAGVFRNTIQHSLSVQSLQGTLNT